MMTNLKTRTKFILTVIAIILIAAVTNVKKEQIRDTYLSRFKDYIEYIPVYTEKTIDELFEIGVQDGE